MATLETIVAAVRSEIVASTDSVDAANVVQDDVEKAGSLPSIVFEYFPTKQRFNDTGSGADDVVTDENGLVTHLRYEERVEVLFDITVHVERGNDPLSIYEDVRSHSARYEEWLDPSEIHDDVENVRVEDSDPENTQQFRGQTLEIYVRFERVLERPVDAMEEIDVDVGESDFTIDAAD